MTDTPSTFYLYAVADLCRDLDPAVRTDPAALVGYFQHAYQTHIEALRVRPDDAAERLGAFVFAVGLFASGRLDVVDAILQRPAGAGAVGNLYGVLTALLPIDKECASEPQRLRRWLARHGGRLRFDRDLGVYRLGVDGEES